MAEKDKKFYWIKLRQSLLTSEKVDFLMSQKNGAYYVVLYQCLCLKTINSAGELANKVGELIIPFDEQKIERECKWFDIDTIRVAMSLYKKLGLIYEQENGILKITDFEDLVGGETYWAEKKRLQREKKKEIGQSLDNVQETLISNISISNNIATNEEIDNYFDKIYSIYPRKVSKVQAKKTFTNKLVGLEKETAKKKAVAIYRLLENQIQVWQAENDGQGRKVEHTPYFSSWCNSNVEDSPKFSRRNKK